MDLVRDQSPTFSIKRDRWRKKTRLLLAEDRPVGTSGACPLDWRLGGFVTNLREECGPGSLTPN